MRMYWYFTSRPPVAEHDQVQPADACAYRYLLEAVTYQSGQPSALCRVSLGEDATRGGKSWEEWATGQEWTYHGVLDVVATVLLMDRIARWCALDVVDLWRAPADVRRFLETGDDTLRAASHLAAVTAAERARTLAVDTPAKSAERALLFAQRNAADAAMAAAWDVDVYRYGANARNASFTSTWARVWLMTKDLGAVNENAQIAIRGAAYDKVMGTRIYWSENTAKEAFAQAGIVIG